MAAQLEAVRGAVERGVDQREVLALLPAGGARCALDAAVWDLEAKRSGRSVAERLGLSPPADFLTAVTIGIRSLDAYEARARALGDFPLLKVKVDARMPLEAVAAVRRGAGSSAIIVDPNQSWTAEQTLQLAPALKALGVVLLEQPIPAQASPALAGRVCPIPICADEAIRDVRDLAEVSRSYQFINIKLDKTGGLTAALALADAAEALGLGLMVGCMAGGSLAMAPAAMLVPRCRFVDLDAPMLFSADWADGMTYRAGRASFPSRRLWG
jgi:L-alanine-DL-glutamate epimerase-like enolase superfamily enzyme